MKVFYFFLLLSFLTINIINAQTIRPNEKSKYFGLEVGVNKVQTFGRGEQSVTPQFGLAAEYYIAPSFSAIARLKVFKTGLSFYNEGHVGGFLSTTQEESYGHFSGTVIAVPLSFKWEFTLIKNLRGYVKAGPSLAFEISSKYDFTENQRGNYTRVYPFLNGALGFTYFINQRTALYMELEGSASAGIKGMKPGTLLTNPKPYSVENTFINFGIKRDFRKIKAVQK